MLTDAIFNAYTIKTLESLLSTSTNQIVRIGKLQQIETVACIIIIQCCFIMKALTYVHAFIPLY